MFDDAGPPDADLPAWLADVAEPDWPQHPVYSQLLSGTERLQVLAATAPVARATVELAELDARALSPAERVDLLSLG
jgi:hypothetical protein